MQQFFSWKFKILVGILKKWSKADEDPEYHYKGRGELEGPSM